MAERKLYKRAFHRQFIRQLIADEMTVIGTRPWKML